MFTSRQKNLLVVTLLALALLIPAVALAQGGGEGQQTPVTDDDVNRVSSQLYCPVCRNVRLDVCPTAACESWRAQVRTLLEGGATDQEVIDYFVAQFGQRVLPEGQQPPITDDDVNRLSSQLYCPVCENVPLDVCPTAACERWRAQVRTLLEDGASDQEVINYFVEQFGQRVVGFPQDPTLAFLAVFVPAVAAVIGLSLASWYVVRWRRNNHLLQQQAAPGEAVPDDYRSRLERELRNLDV